MTVDDARKFLKGSRKMEKAYDEIHKDKMKDVLRIRMQLDEYKK